MRKIVFEKDALADFKEWSEINVKIYNKIIDIVNDITNTPFKGLGKPEPLRFELRGYWSRRINKEHRLVYKVTESDIIIISCKYHYN